MAYEDVGWDPGAPGVSSNMEAKAYISSIYWSDYYAYCFTVDAYWPSGAGAGKCNLEYWNGSSYVTDPDVSIAPADNIVNNFFHRQMKCYGYRANTWVQIRCPIRRSDDTIFSYVYADGFTTPAAQTNYTISYNNNGGTGTAPSSQTAVNGTSVKLAFQPSVTKTGYTSDGWADSATGFISKAFGANYTITSNKTFYLHWSPNTYTVTANPNSGTLSATSGWSISGGKGTKTVTYDSTYGTLCSVSRTGYTLKGWYTATSGGTKIETSTKVAITNNQNIYAQWTANTYKVSFNKNGGSGSMNDQTFTYDTAQALTANAFSRTGYTFAGWATSASGSVVYSNKQSVKNLATSGTVTLYAKWTANTYTVTLNKNGGSGGNASVNIVYDTAAGSYPSVGTLPTKTGYIFNGYWTAASGGTQYYNGSGSSVRTFDIANNTIFYAHWTPITYTIKYVGNGNTSGTMSNTSATYNVSVKLRKNAFVRTNYNFLYWVYNNSTYADEQSVSNLTTTNGATINMTAQWRGVASTVSFNSNGTIESTKTVYFAETYGTLPTPTSRGAYWKFMGWYTGTNGSGTRITKNTVVNVTANSTLYAYWVEIQNTFVKVNGVWKNVTPNGNRFIYVDGLGWKPIKEIYRCEVTGSTKKWKINKNKDN